MRKNSLLFIFHLIGSFYLIQTSQIEKFILILLLQGIFIFFEYKNSKGDVYIQEKYFLFYILLFTLLTQKIIFNSFLLTFCMMLGIYFTLSSIISFFYLILEEKKFEIFYLVATFVYLILFCLIIFIEYLKTYMNSDEFYYFIYYIYSFLLCFLLKKDIEQRNPYIDIIKTHKFDIYSLSFISFNIFFIWFLLYIGNIYRNYYLLYVYVLVILSIVICQNFISFKINKFFKFILTILIFLIIIFFINKKIYYVLIDQNIIKNIKTFLILYIIVLPLIIPLNIYSSSGDKVYTAFGVKLKDEVAKDIVLTINKFLEKCKKESKIKRLTLAEKENLSEKYNSPLEERYNYILNQIIDVEKLFISEKDNNFIINGDSEAIKNLEIFKDTNFEEIDFYIFYVNYLSKKEYENKKVLVGYNGIDGKEVTMSKLKEDINEIRDSRSIYGREVEK